MKSGDAAKSEGKAEAENEKVYEQKQLKIQAPAPKVAGKVFQQRKHKEE